MSEQQTPHTTGRPGRWAKPVSRLVVPGLPKEAINLNVQGRRPSSPVKGMGQLWQRTYQIRLEGAAVTPVEVVAAWKERFASFWPPGSHGIFPCARASGCTSGPVAVAVSQPQSAGSTPLADPP